MGSTVLVGTSLSALGNSRTAASLRLSSLSCVACDLLLACSSRLRLGSSAGSGFPISVSDRHRTPLLRRRKRTVPQAISQLRNDGHVASNNRPSTDGQKGPATLRVAESQPDGVIGRGRNANSSSLARNVRVDSTAAVAFVDSPSEEDTSREKDGKAVSDGVVLTCTTFNMLAPIFKRINREGQRESEFRELWLPRSERILETLVATGSSIVCLQECWLSHPEWVRLFDSALGAAGYRTLKLPRTNNRGDGLMIAVKNEQWRVVDYQQLLFHDCGDRVAQIVRLRSKGRLGGKKEGEEGGQEEQQEEEEDLLVVNTHLLFPHDANSNIIRLCQVYKLLERVEQCRSEQSGRPAPVILCGDLNGTKEGNVYKLLRSQGFLSSYDTAHHLNDVDEKWVSHRSHRGDVCGVDYVWMLNASTPMSNPVLNWRKAVFGLIKSKLLAAGITDARHAFQFFATAGDTSPYEHTVCFTDPNATGAVDISVDYGRQQGDTNAIEKSESESESGEEEDEEAWRFYDSDEEGRERQECCITAFTIEDFQLAVAQLGLTGDNSIGLTEVEVMELMQGADTDGDGWVDFNEFQDMFQQPTWDSRVDTLKQSMAASLAASLAATSATSSAPASASGSASAAAASVASATAAATAATVTSASRTSSSAPLSSSSVSSRNLSGSVQQESQQQQRWEEKEQAVLQGEQPYWESRRGLNVEGEAAQRSNHCRDGSSSAGADADADATRASGGEEMERVGSGSHFFGTNAGGSVPEGLGAVEECEIEPSNRGLSLSVLKASLFPPEMEEGRWPEEYTLSDHAVLTVMFGREREEVRE